MARGFSREGRAGAGAVGSPHARSGQLGSSSQRPRQTLLQPARQHPLLSLERKEVNALDFVRIKFCFAALFQSL